MAIGIVPFNIVIVCFNLTLISYVLFQTGSSIEIEESITKEILKPAKPKVIENECVYGIKSYSSGISTKHYFKCGSEGEPQLLKCMEEEYYSSMKGKCVKEEERKKKKSINALALGRVFELGNFYDARKNTFFPDASLWSKATID